MRSPLQLRLRNCLQTIIELEPRMERLPVYVHFQDDIQVLKNCLTEIDHMQLNEDEVLRLEKATTTFLQELWLPLQRTYGGEVSKKVLQ